MADVQVKNWNKHVLNHVNAQPIVRADSALNDRLSMLISLYFAGKQDNVYSIIY